MPIDNSLDQALPISPTDLRALDVVDEILNEAMENTNPAPLIKHALLLRRSGAMAAVSLAKLLYSMFVNRDELMGLPDADDFFDYIQERVGLTGQTTTKYLRVWTRLFGPDAFMPVNYAPRMMGKPMTSLLLIAPGAESYSEEVWQMLAAAPDEQSIKRIVRGVRGEATSSNTGIAIWLQRDGTLMCKRGSEGEMIAIGYLNLDAALDQTGQSAIERIMTAAKIQRM